MKLALYNASFMPDFLLTEKHCEYRELRNREIVTYKKIA